MIELNPNGLTIVQLTSEVKDRLPSIRHCCRIVEQDGRLWLYAGSLPKMIKPDPIQATYPTPLSEIQIKEALGVYAK
jgi:hypothetical protein